MKKILFNIPRWYQLNNIIFIFSSMFVFLSSCTTEQIEGWNNYVKTLQQESLKKEKYSIDMNDILDDFVLFKPSTESILCAEEYIVIIEKTKKSKIPKRAKENILILCHKMILEKQADKALIKSSSIVK